jgi:yecA family protein
VSHEIPCDPEQLSEQLVRAGVPMSVSEIHGVACGLLCGLAEDVEGLWYQALYSELDMDDVRVQECRNSTDAMLQFTAEQLRDEEGFSLDLCLPDEDDHAAFAAGLRDWCQGFLYGVGIASDDIQKHLSEEGNEALKDMSEISKLDVEAVKGGEEEAEALSQVEEYLKIAALTIRQDLLSAEKRA